MAGITELPCEVVISILRRLDNVCSLLPFLLTCRHVYLSFKENPTLVADVLQRQVTPGLVPYAIAVLESARLEPHTPDTVSRLLDTLYNDRAALVSRLLTMPVPLLARMGRMHNVIDSMTAEFASSAWARLGEEDDLHLPQNVSLSPTEYFRFCRAFYRVELYTKLFGSKGRMRAVDNYEPGKECFFLRHPLWENEQLGCAYDFLELKFAKASHGFLAHDVFCGTAEMDYLTSGDNLWRQLGIAQGLGYIQRLSNESSYDGRAALLDFGTFGNPTAALSHPLYHSLIAACEAKAEDGLSGDDLPGHDPFPRRIKNEYDRLLQNPDIEDVCCDGPFDALDLRCGLLGPWVMLDHNSWLRERAYVLWDSRRIDRHGMWGMIEAASADSELLQAEADIEDMEESFIERSEISALGGQGYWSKGDTSRIVWSLPPVEDDD